MHARNEVLGAHQNVTHDGPRGEGVFELPGQQKGEPHFLSDELQLVETCSEHGGFRVYRHARRPAHFGRSEVSRWCLLLAWLGAQFHEASPSRLPPLPIEAMCLMSNSWPKGRLDEVHPREVR